MTNIVIKRQKILSSLHFIRGLAAIGIVLFHLTNELATRFHYRLLGGLFLTSYSGVDVFFVLSGFVLYYLYQSRQGQKKEIKNFLLKRFIRLYPPYWIATVIIIVGFLVLKTHLFASFSFTIPFILNTIFLLPHDGRLIPPAWTLTYELYFYFLFILVFLFKDKKTLAKMAVIYSIIIVYVALWITPFIPILKVGHSASTFLQLISGVYSIEFFMGIIAAYLLQNSTLIHHGKISFWAGILLFIISAIANSYFHISGTILEEFRFIYFGLPAMFIIYGCAALELKRSAPFPSLFTHLGNVSFSLYLTHYAVIQLIVSRLGALVNKNPSGALFFGVALIAFVVSMMVAILFHYIVEKNILRVLRGMI